MLGQPISMLIPEVIGFRIDGKLPEGTTATDLVLTVTADAAQEGRGRKVRRVLRAGPLQPDRRGPRDHRQHGAGIWRDLRALPDRARHDHLPRRRPGAIPTAWRWSKPMPRRRACGAPTMRPTRSSPTRWSSTSAPSCPRSPARSGRRTAWRFPPRRAEFAKALPRNPRRRAEEGERREHQLRDRRRPCGHRGDHVLHQHLQSERADRRRPACQEGARAGPAAEAVGEDIARAGLAGGDGISRRRPGCRSISTRSASTSSATAARPASAIPGRCPRRSPRRSTRTTSSPARCFPATATSRAASIRTCARTISPPRRSSSPMRSPARSRSTSRREPLGMRAGRQAGLPEGHLAELSGDLRADPQGDLARDVPRPLRRRLQGRRELAQDPGRGRPHLRLVGRLDLRAEPALLHRHEADAGAADRCRRRAHPRALPRFDHHRPHLARRLDQARRPGRRISRWRIRCGRWTSTPTARGAATTK